MSDKRTYFFTPEWIAIAITVCGLIFSGALIYGDVRQLKDDYKEIKPISDKMPLIEYKINLLLEHFKIEVKRDE